MEVNGYALRGEIVASLQRDPLAVVDVGAAGGAHRRYGNSLSRVIAFEPDEQGFAEASAIAPKNVTLIPEALWSESATMPLYVTRSRRCCSLYPPNMTLADELGVRSRFHVERTIDVHCRRLSEVLEERGLEDVDYIKLDTQGSELAILRGGEDLLRRYVTGLEVEAEFLSLYEGQPLFPEVHVYLDSLGFRLADIKPSYYAPDQRPPAAKGTGFVGFVDARYFKPAHVVRDMLENHPSPRSKLHRTMYSLALHYNRELIAPFERLNLEDHSPAVRRV